MAKTPNFYRRGSFNTELSRNFFHFFNMAPFSRFHCSMLYVYLCIILLLCLFIISFLLCKEIEEVITFHFLFVIVFV